MASRFSAGDLSLKLIEIHILFSPLRYLLRVAKCLQYLVLVLLPELSLGQCSCRGSTQRRMWHENIAKVNELFLSAMPSSLIMKLLIQRSPWTTYSRERRLGVELEGLFDCGMGESLNFTSPSKKDSNQSPVFMPTSPNLCWTCLLNCLYTVVHGCLFAVSSDWNFIHGMVNEKNSKLYQTNTFDIPKVD